MGHAAQALRRFYERAGREELSVEDIQLGLVEISHQRTGQEADSPALLLPRRSELTARTPRQAQYLQAMRNFDITFCIGPAGTGKTFLAVAAAVDALEADSVKRIGSRGLGRGGRRSSASWGDLAQKVDPYLRPLYDALYDLMGYDKVRRSFERVRDRDRALGVHARAHDQPLFVISTRRRNTTPAEDEDFLNAHRLRLEAVVTAT